LQSNGGGAAEITMARISVIHARIPRQIWWLWSNNPQLNEEIRRRTDIIGIFPGGEAIRIVGAMLSEQNDD
jgi:transposase-like protein